MPNRDFRGLRGETGTGRPEFLVGVAVYAERQAGPRSWRLEHLRAYLLILDQTGQPLVQRAVGENLELLTVMEPERPGDLPTILCGDGQFLRRFRFVPSASQEP